MSSSKMYLRSKTLKTFLNVIFLAILVFSLGCPNANNSHSVPKTSNPGSVGVFMYPAGWPLASLTPPPGSSPHAIFQGVSGAGKLSHIADYIDYKSYMIGFKYPGGWNKVVAHIEKCLSGTQYTILENSPGSALEIKYEGEDRIMLHQSNKDQTLFLLIIDGP